MNQKEIQRGALISAGIGFAVSFALNCWLIPVPQTALANGIGAGICGCINAFVGAWTAGKSKKEA